jgi:hypothetical protein
VLDIQKVPGRVFILAVAISATALLAPQVAQAQGTMTYLSNLGQPSTGSRAVGTNSWLAMEFHTGNNTGGYLLDSIQFALTDASGNPSNFTAMIYTEVGFDGAFPGSSLGTLDGSLSPVSSGVYTYTDDSSITLSPNDYYFIVLTAGTTVVNGAYEWSLAGANSYNPTGGWGVEGGNSTAFFSSINGSSWNPIGFSFPQFAINATAIPEPSSEILLGLGGVFFGLVRWKAKSIA